MNVFVSETCYRQVFGSKKGSSLRRIDDFNRLVGRLREIGSRGELQVKGLGTKKYRSMGGRDVYGVDLNNGLTAERVIFRFVEPGDAAAARFGRYGSAGQAETVLLCYCSEHDSQHRHARLVADAAARGQAPDVAWTLPDAAAAELARVEADEVPWRTYADGDLERYGRPRTPVLTEDKFRIVADFLAADAPMLVTGAAGSGKTELGLRILHDFSRSWVGRQGGLPRVLYVTFSQRLLSEVESRVGADVRPGCDFMTYDTLLRTLWAEPDLRFASAKTFSSFIGALRARTAMGGPSRAKMLRLVDERGEGCVYAEVYGVICGGMGPGWDRWPEPDAQRQAAPTLERDAYLALPDASCGLTTREDREAAYLIAEGFVRWVASARLLERSGCALALATAVERPRYDLVIADEVQDLTEVQTELLARLAGGAPGEGACRLFMTGDVNQVLTPTAFDARRFLRLGRGLRLERLAGNFRNPEAVCELANAVAQIREESPRLPARRAGEAAPERAYNRSAGRTLWCLCDDEGLLCQMVDEGANIALVCDPATYRRLRPVCSSVFTVDQVKGMEFDNVVLYGVLSAERARLDAVLASGPKDASLHRPLNRLYVGLTRSCGSLLVVEPRGGQMLARLVGLDPRFERVDDPLDVDFDLDASAYGYLQVALSLKDQGAYAQARANFERALAVSARCARVPKAAGLPVVADEPLSPAEEEEARRQIRTCTLYLDHGEASEGELAHLFELAGLYEEALPHARAALDDRRAALLTLAAERGLDGARFSVADRLDAFERAAERAGLDLDDLWGLSDAFDRLLLWYLGERADDIELLSMETSGLVSRTGAILKGLPVGLGGRRGALGTPVVE